MDARELRYGNFAFCERCDGTKVETQAFELKASGKWVSRIGLPITAPIPLTEEWHNRFGTQMGAFRSFVYEYAVGKSIVFSGDYVYLINTERIDGQRGFGDDCCVLWSKDIKGRDMYVHEWQNLYFALTGAELEQKKQ